MIKPDRSNNNKNITKSKQLLCFQFHYGLSKQLCWLLRSCSYFTLNCLFLFLSFWCHSCLVTHRLTPCYFKAGSLLCGVSSLSAMCLLCKQCAEACGHSTAYGRQSGRRCERADVRGREFNAFSWED